MTTDEVIADMKKKLDQMDKAFEIAVRSTHAQQMQRIFVDGERSSGAKIGKYNSTNQLYVNPKNAPRKFTPLGKNQKRSLKTTVFNIKSQKARRVSIKKNFTERKTRWFSSYKDFRQFEGRESGFVNLTLFGKLQSDLANSVIRLAPGRYALGVKNRANADKLLGAIDKYGLDVFKPSQKEKDTLNSVFEAEMQKILQ